VQGERAVRDERARPLEPSVLGGFILCALVLLVSCRCSTARVGRASPVALPDYLVPLLGKYLCYAILALSLDLVWGYADPHPWPRPFFALGGYCMGMYLMRQIVTRGLRQPAAARLYGVPAIQELPWFCGASTISPMPRRW